MSSKARRYLTIDDFINIAMQKLRTRRGRLFVLGVAAIPAIAVLLAPGVFGTQPKPVSAATTSPPNNQMSFEYLTLPGGTPVTDLAGNKVKVPVPPTTTAGAPPAAWTLGSALIALKALPPTPALAPYFPPPPAPGQSYVPPPPSTPGTTVPHTTTPHSTIPGSTAPGTTVPDTTVTTDTTVPDTTVTTDTTVPDTTVTTDTTVPDTTVTTDTTVPDTTPTT
ncbi:MAG TPA: hypothetical protein VFR41_15550 [Acidimicrobiia bacterium]|nr:hypothetical protein [Acidimicrobiia bacterium]